MDNRPRLTNVHTKVILTDRDHDFAQKSIEINDIDKIMVHIQLREEC